MPRALLKAAVERATLAAFRALGRPGTRGRRIILAYHNVVPDAEPACGDRSLHLPLARFLEHVALLQARCEVLPLAELLEDRGDPRRPRVAITFDDAYRGAVRLGIAALQDRGLPATVFVAPRYVGDATFWWDRWLDAPAGADEFRHRALAEAGGDEGAVDRLGELLARPAWSPGSWHRCVTLDELTAAVGRGGLVVGSHSWHHWNLAAARDDAALQATLHDTLRWIGQFGSATTPILCLPYGAYDDRTLSVAGAIGHPHAVRVDGGALPPVGALPFLLPRLTIPAGLSEAGLALRLGA